MHENYEYVLYAERLYADCVEYMIWVGYICLPQTIMFSYCLFFLFSRFSLWY